jgi:hypothetical protein
MTMFTPEAAVEALMNGTAPDGMQVFGHLDLSVRQEEQNRNRRGTLRTLGADKPITLPRDMTVTHLSLNGCTWLAQLPAGLTCEHLEVRNTKLGSLPADLRVRYKLDLRGCIHLETLPNELRVTVLDVSGCVRLAALPDGLTAEFLVLTGCINLQRWPAHGRIEIGNIMARDCHQLPNLPTWITQLSILQLRSCSNITALHDGLRVSNWLEVADTQIRELPPSLQGTRLLWKGIHVDERIAFRPETITSDEILAEVNAERRRILTERMGFDKFVQGADANVIHQDTERNGDQRQLLRVPMDGDEDLVVLSVNCPSTGRHYMLRVPPTTRTCHQAAAWIAGFDNPDDYRPIMET